MTSDQAPKTKTRDEIAAAYVSEPWWYDVRGFFILTFAYNSTIWGQLGFFSRNFGARHLEVACGTGTLLELVLKWRAVQRKPRPLIVGVDYAESMLAGALHRFRKSPDMTFLHGDAAAMPFEDASFDTANVANAVHCFPDVRGAFAGVFKVLRPGGTMAANVLLYPRGWFPFRQIAQAINDWGIRKGILVTPYRHDEVVNMIRDAGFEILEDKIQGNCANILARRPING